MIYGLWQRLNSFVSLILFRRLQSRGEIQVHKVVHVLVVQSCTCTSCTKLYMYYLYKVVHVLFVQSCTCTSCTKLYM